MSIIHLYYERKRKERKTPIRKMYEDAKEFTPNKIKEIKIKLIELFGYYMVTDERFE